ncbi:MAG: hypothetical protein NZ455_11270 [Bacteroidia bacterium]|nr:hypothetical protein [Bacteroidia bacterium]MDW8346555.1 hypothetical protein [Bacteroidia bacterium]
MEFLVYTFLYALFLYVIGYFTLSLCRIKINEPFARLFAANTLGMILWAWVIAFLRTHGMTIMNGVWIPLLSIAWYLHKNGLWNRDKFNIQLRIDTSHMLWIGILLILIIVNYLFNLGNPLLYPVTDNIDSIYYVRLSEFIYRVGVESTNIDYLQIKSNYPNPYHYFAPWLQAGFNAIFNIENNYLVRKVIIFSIYFANFYIALLGILKAFVKKQVLKWYHYIIPVLFFFIKPIGLGSLTASIYGSYTLYWVNSLVQLPKHSPIMMMILSFVLLTQHKQYTLAIISLLVIPIFYISTAPGITAIIIFFVLWAWTRKINHVKLIYVVVPSILIAAYGTIFYAFYPKQNYIVNPTGNTRYFWERFYDLSFVPILLKDILRISFAFTLSISPLIGISFFHINKINEHIKSQRYIWYLIYFILIGMLCGLLSWQILYYIWDSEQFFACIASPLYTLLVFLWISLLLEICTQDKNIFGKILTWLIIAYTCALLYSAIHASVVRIKTYNAEYGPEYVTYIKKNKNRFSEYGAVLIEDQYLWYYYFHAFPKPYIQNVYPRDFLAINVCDLNIPPNSLDYQYLRLFSFYQFVEKQKQEGSFSSTSQSKIDFIKKYRINHIVAYKNAPLDTVFLPYIREQYVDKYSGERLYFLDIP